MECAGENFNMGRLQTEEGKGVDRWVGECVGYRMEISGLRAVTDCMQVPVGMTSTCVQRGGAYR